MTPSPDDTARETFFGPEVHIFATSLEAFARQASPKRYEYVPLDEYSTITDVPRRNQIYWREILYRAHFGASTSILRLHHWLDGTRRAAADSNPLLTAAGMRGLIEAAADSYHSFRDVVVWLAENHVYITGALEGTLEKLLLGPELENSLIHFMYGRKLEREEVAPPTHAALEANDYVKELAAEVPGAYDAYTWLCQFTHPAAMSLVSYWGPDQSRAFVFDPGRTDAMMNELRARSVLFGSGTLACGISPCAITLKILNFFPLPEVHTEWAEELDVRSSELWSVIEERLKDPSPPTQPTCPEDIKRLIDHAIEQGTPVVRGRPPKHSKPR